MTTQALADVFAAHLTSREISLVDGLGRPMDPVSKAYALKELAEVAEDAATEWYEVETSEIPAELLAKVREESR